MGIVRMVGSFEAGSAQTEVEERVRGWRGQERRHGRKKAFCLLGNGC